MRQPRFHYAWIIAAATFVVLLMTAGIRATPGVLMVPLEEALGWSRSEISLGPLVLTVTVIVVGTLMGYQHRTPSNKRMQLPAPQL